MPDEVVKLYAYWPDDVCGAVRWVNGLRSSGDWSYRVSQDATQSTVIASATAALLWGFLGVDNALSDLDRNSWANFLASAQGDDGLVNDSIDYAEPTQAQPLWALRAHRTRHVGWAVRCLTGKPLPRPIVMVEPLLDRSSLKNRLDTLWNECGDVSAWAWGNWVMDLGVLLELRDAQGIDDDARSREAGGWLLDWLNERIDPVTGFWWPGRTDDRAAMAGAMHLYPLYWARGLDVPYFDRAVDATLALQQSDGLFAYETGCGGSQCLDYDAMLILVNGWHRLPQRRSVIESSAARVLDAIQVCRNSDGSWADCRIDELRYWATRASVFHASRGSIWDAYARLMTIAMCVEVLTGSPPQGVRTSRHLFELFRPLEGSRA
jgi:hypothetical protein